MAVIQDEGQIGAKHSASRNKKVTGAKLFGTKVICIIIRSTAQQSRSYEHKLCNFHINQGHMNIN
jgi:hypothetical protein